MSVEYVARSGTVCVYRIVFQKIMAQILGITLAFAIIRRIGFLRESNLSVKSVKV